LHVFWGSLETEFRTTARKNAGNMQQAKYWEYRELKVFETGINT